MEKNKWIERILLIMKHYKLNQRQFALKTEISPQSFNSMIVRNHEPKLSTIADILQAFPEVSIEWLVLGDGDMIKPPKEDENWKVTEFIPIPNKEVEQLEDHIRTLKELNELLREKIKVLEAEKKVAPAVPYGFVAAESLTKNETASDVKQ